MPAAAAARLGFRRGFFRLGFADSVHQCRELIGSRGAGLIAKLKPEDFPAAGRSKALCMEFAQVVAVWFRVRCQRTQDCGGIGVHVRQSSDGGLPAR